MSAVAFWARQDRAQKARDAERAERIRHHVKYGDRYLSGELYPFECCTCWGCRGSVVGTESEGQE